jgi:arginyl-tRNA synthetase
LIKKLSEYKQVIEKTAQSAYPHILANYVYELTKLFNAFYNNLPVLKEEDEEKKYSRLALIKQTTSTIEDAFNLL